MTDAQMIALVQRYFAAVDAQNLDGVLSTLTPDCRFSVETHGVILDGHTEIASMMQRLWANHEAVLHDQFTFVPAATEHRIAAQFQVTNTLSDGRKVHKSNCNFFHVNDACFDSVAVYMSGENTLNKS